ncbi:hypothetical protein [Aliarcobacter cibarius]|uniref:Uncharacterized protein n=1 Tax=Aliarcobacter cibarius TaxID=255507 RepID=A0ABY2V6Q2_9BACT|nr:hypothetical protein [Aliarcobacter cibarius]TLS99916.1 hypothetical protein FE247_05135 [Aliarcobacter cibarius]TLT00325.1 hypothetical protein FE245_05565 [Aliarcobacter cibarius]
MEIININKDIFQNLDDARKSKLREKIGNGELSINIIDNSSQEEIKPKENMVQIQEPKQEKYFLDKVKDFGKTYADNIADTFVGARPFGTEDATKDLKNKIFDNVLGGFGGVQEIADPLKVENQNQKFQDLENNLKQEIKKDTENKNKKIEDNLIQDIENLSKIDTRLISEASQEQKDKYLNNVAGILGKGGYALGQKEDGNYIAIDKEGNEKEIKNDLWNSILDGIKADAGEFTGAIYGAKKGLDLSKNMKNPIAKTATIAGSSLTGSVAGNILDMGINQLKDRENLAIEDILNELGKTAALDVVGNVIGAGIVKVGGKIIELPKQARDFVLNGNIQGARDILKKDLNIDDKYIEDALDQMKQNYKESDNYSKNIAPEDTNIVSKVINKVGGDLRNQIGQQEELLAATLKKGDTNIIAGALDETAARNLSNTIDQRATNVLNELDSKSSKAGGEEIKNYLNDFEQTAKQDFTNMRKDFSDAFKEVNYKFDLEDLNLNDTFKDMAKRVQDPDAKKRFLTLQSAIKNTIYDSNAQVGIERDINGLLDMRQQLNKFYGQNERYLANKRDKDTFNALKENIDTQITKAVDENLPPELGTRLMDSFAKSMGGYRELGKLQDNKVFNSIMGDANNPEFRMDKLVKHMADDDSYVDDVLSKMTPQARQTVEVAVIKELADSYTLKTAQGQKAIAFEDLGKELEGIKRNVRSELGKETIDNLITYAEKFGNRDISYLDMTRGIITKPKGNISTSLGGKIEMQISSWRFDMLQRILPTDTGKRLSLQRHIREALHKSRTPQEFDLKLYEYPDLSDNSRDILKSMIKSNNKIIASKNEEEAQKALEEAKLESQKIIDNENNLKNEIANFKTPDIYETRTVAGLTPDDKFGSFTQMTTKIQKGIATEQEIEQYIKARNNIKPEDLEKNVLKIKYPINSRVVEKFEELQTLNKEKVDEIVNQDEFKALIFNLKKDQLPNTTLQIEEKYRQKFYELNKIYDDEKAIQKAKIEAENKAFNEADKQGFIPFAKFGDNLLAGTVAGVETDENGNIVGFDPEMFVAGFGGYTALKMALKNKEIQGALKDYAMKIVDYVDMNPALYKKNGLNAMFVGTKPNEIGAFSDVATKKVMREINDSIAIFKPIPKQEVEIDGEFFEQNFGKLGDILAHDELFKQYPNLKEVQVSVNNNIGRGATYNEYIDHIALDGGLVKTAENNVIKDLQNKIKELDKNPIDKDYKILNDKFFDKNLSDGEAEKILNLLDNTPTQIEIDKLSNQLSKEFNLNKQNAKEVEITEEGKITLLHEIQHTIQGRENWARGGSPKEFNLRGSDKLNQSFIDEADTLRKPKVEELISRLSQGKISKEEFKKIYNEMPETQTIREWTENIANSKDPFGAYQRLWGEQQARATSYRANYTPEQRISEDWTNTLEKNEGKYNEPIIKYENRKTSMSIDKDFKDKDGFYSVLEKIVDEKVGGKIDSISLAKVLENNGVKIDELEWSGLKDLLASKEKLTKEEIQNTINENRLVLEKVSLNQNQEINKKLVLDYNDLDKEILDYLNSLDNESKKIAEEMMTVFDRSKITDGTYSKEWNELKSKYPNLDHNIIHEVGEALKDEAIDKNLNRKLPKYSEYKVDGGENYREILFRMPTDIEKKLDNEIKIVDGGDGYFYAEYAPFDGTNVITGAKSKKQLLSEISSGYKSNHWDESNIVVFTRVDDRTIENKKTLFLEELQSDWHQDGRKKGYGKRIPDAPFKKNWSELGIKRMIQEAVENDYDKLAWTTGKQQADRYSLEKQIDTVVYNKESGILQASKDGDEVVFKKVANDEEVAGLLGKDLANRLINPKQSTRDNIYVLEGEEVKFGGDGMKAFYDEIVPNTVKKLFKKYNVKPKMEELDDVSEMVWTIDITQKMKEDIKKYGQPLYAVGGAIAVGNEINNGDNNAK